ncbi:energy transducer TonB [Flavobacterium sp. AS60]|uniref:energy transducer TonB n=1 Tax=Flavobacterium anseongense TaxID=2910677 RepID=UPI001F3C8F88|nr:energy transducer TonB [Flavobacterium sp. AS60]MCF6130549.1 energy transducer TonB [Flavobacterium sp. AS60]
MKKIITLLLLFYSIDNFSQTVKKVEDNNIYNTAGLNTKPEFPGGLDKLKSLVNESYLKTYPAEIKGKVYAIFVIEKDGSLSDVKILRGVDADKAKELIRILENLPKWNPGKIKDQIVRVLYTVQLVIGK